MLDGGCVACGQPDLVRHRVDNRRLDDLGIRQHDLFLPPAQILGTGVGQDLVRLRILVDLLLPRLLGVQQAVAHPQPHE